MTLAAASDVILGAMKLPPAALLSLRVPKKLLVEQGAPTRTDKRLIQDGIEELHWLATLKPTTVAVPAATEPGRECAEIAVIAVHMRLAASVMRITALIHRAIPYPMLLITLGGTSVGAAVSLSVAPKRAARNEGDKLVVERVVATVPFDPLHPSAVECAFLNSLAIDDLPSGDLAALYTGWLARIEALRAGHLSGQYVATDDPDFVGGRREALEAHTQLAREIAGLRARAKRERQLNRLVDLNLRIQRLESRLASHIETL
jgi:hypothetical protein